ncbi:MAG: L-threonylcarbamoyladenylate synthase [Coxiellaceae bacterium]|nr:L-threonylcarbamoyladenylate synthase [Coxiellaceae bacterium]
MTDHIDQSIDAAVACLQRGELIAYPTEAVYGLGCDPWNESAVKALCDLKQRDINKGVILVAADWSQVEPLIQPLPADIQQRVLHSWPGHITWLLPASNNVPIWIRGQHPCVAVRISAHPTVHALCQSFGKPIVSTSANLSQQAEFKTAEQVTQQFGAQLSYVIDAPLGNETQPSTIRDALTNSIIR